MASGPAGDRLANDTWVPDEESWETTRGIAVHAFEVLVLLAALVAWLRPAG